MTAALAATEPLTEAVQRLRDGGLVAYPTETVFGLGVDARDPEAVARLRAWKGRDDAQPISLLVTGLAAAEVLGVTVSPAARRVAAAFWPGALTLVLPAAAKWVPGIARTDGAVGLRCSSHPVAAALAHGVEQAGFGPVTATSLNRSGEPPAADLAAARRLCSPRRAAPWILEVADAWAQEPSSVLDLTGPEPAMLRRGHLDSNALDRALEEQRNA